MFTDFSNLLARSELHRKELLADADNYRLAQLAATVAPRRSGAADPARGPRDDGATGPGSAEGKLSQERRYAVSR